MTGLIKFSVYIILVISILSLGFYSGIIQTIGSMTLTIKNDFLVYLPMELRMILYSLLVGILMMVAKAFTHN